MKISSPNISIYSIWKLLNHTLLNEGTSFNQGDKSPSHETKLNNKNY